MTSNEVQQPQFRIVLGSDDAGLEYKEALKADLMRDERVATIRDIGTFSDNPQERAYPSVAVAAAEAIAEGTADRAILICGTGIGMAVAANKVAGIRATVAHDSFSVERSVLSNNCQVLTLGQRVIGLQLARRLASEWLSYTFDEQSPSSSKVGLISQYEQGTHRADRG